MSHTHAFTPTPKHTPHTLMFIHTCILIYLHHHAHTLSFTHARLSYTLHSHTHTHIHTFAHGACSHIHTFSHIHILSHTSHTPILTHIHTPIHTCHTLTCVPTLSHSILTVTCSAHSDTHACTHTEPVTPHSRR